ncbi:MAG: hypothetical protein LBS74_07360, partial [Oscillospiraceae bacterium]|nr:hypothetical protein [Oscillospiraceae bacterium]
MSKKEIKKIEGKKFFNYKRRFGDRNDGWRVRSHDPFFGIIPHLMHTRLDSMVFFEEKIDLEDLEAFVRQQRKDSDMTDLSIVMVIMSACLRAMAQYPKANRFIAGRKIFARNYLSIAMVIKKELTKDSTETTICPRFDPDASLHDVWETIHKAIDASKKVEDSNSTEKFAAIVNRLPVPLIQFFIFLIKAFDYCGLLPKALIKIIPFHTSYFITDIGSTGIGSVYHHLYEFGTCSVFLSMGKKEKYLALDGDGKPVERKFVNLRFVVDERVTDGFYYASVMKYLRKLLKNP